MNWTDPAGPRDEPLGVGPAVAWSFFDQLLRYAPAPIYVASPEGRYLFVNRAWERLTRIPRRRAVGRRTGDMFSAETARRLQEANRRVVRTGEPVQVEEVVEAADGVRRYHTVKFPVRDAAGALVGVGGVSIDVTDRRRAEGAVKELSRLGEGGGRGRPAGHAASDPFKALTPREREVFLLTAEGLSGSDAAARLFISRRTVESHRANLMRKLGLRNHKELIRYAVRRGLLADGEGPPAASEEE